MRDKLFLLLVLFFLSVELVTAQSRDVSGVVMAVDGGKPVVGASVLVVGTDIGSITDDGGHFILRQIPQEAKQICVTFVGMHAKFVSIKPILQIWLQTNEELLDEVVVTGMQHIDKRLFTGATTKLQAEDFKMDGVPEISRSLEGRVAGVSVQNVSNTFGVSPNIHVRGATSIYGSSKPLWVVDGVVVDDLVDISLDELSTGNPITLMTSAISGLNAEDIESIQVLKDGSATSIYGAQAMAGVIVVTTKKGHTGVHQINYTGEFTYRFKPSYRDYDIMNSQEQMEAYQEMQSAGFLNLSDTYRAQNSGVYGRMYHMINSYDPMTGYGLPNTISAKTAFLHQAELRNTNWFDALYNDNVLSNHSISIASGTEQSTYYASLSFMNDPGWTKQSEVKRYTANLHATYKLHPTLSAHLISNASYRIQRAPGTSISSLDSMEGETNRNFEINPYTYALSSSRTLQANTYYIKNYAPFNILDELNNNYLELNVSHLKFQGQLIYKPNPNLQFSLLGAYKYVSSTQTHRVTEHSNQAMTYRMASDPVMRNSNAWLYLDPEKPGALPVSVLPSGGFYNETKYTMNSWNVRSTVSYKNAFAQQHIVNIFGGLEVNSLNRNADYFSGVGTVYDSGCLPSYDYTYFKQLAEEGGQYYWINDASSREVAFFASSTYSYKKKYTLNATARYEGSNHLGKSMNARWLPTWNVSGAWGIHSERFWQYMPSWLSDLTLKTSYSLTADRGPVSVTNSQVLITSYTPYRPFSDLQKSGLHIDNLANEDLTYEKKHEWNIGVDMGLFNNRIRVVTDWYTRHNYDLIGNVTTQGVGGQVTKLANVAAMKTSGVEVSIQSHTIQAHHFSWDTSLVFTKMKNKVTDLKSSSRAIDLVSGSGYAMEGYPVRALFSYDFQGLNEVGLPTFINRDGDLTISDINFQERNFLDHLKYEGSTLPDITGSLNNVFKYKDLTFNVFLTYAFGAVVRLNPVYSSSYTDLLAMPLEFVNRWMQAGDENRTNVPAIATQRQNQTIDNLNLAYNAYNYSTVRVAKGDHIRLKEISLAYDLPEHLLSKLWVKSLSAKIQVSNLCLLYKDSALHGQDPQYCNAGGVSSPLPKQCTMTIRMGF